MKPLLPISDIARRRFWQKVKKGGRGECWPWLGALTDRGYGFCFPYGAKGGQFRAHRVALYLATGHDPGILGAVHACDNPPCCNPAHVIPSTQARNLANMRAKDRGRLPPQRSGENAPHAILTDEQVAEIRVLSGTTDRNGYWSERRLAARFDIAHSQIHRIIRGESRKH